MVVRKLYPTLMPEEAAALIPDAAIVAAGGFTPAGSPKVVPRALARRARALHESDQPFQVRLISGASTGEAVDDELSDADAISWRAPYLTSVPLRQRVNAGRVDFVDMHLWHVSQMVLEGFLGRIDFAIVEAAEITPGVPRSSRGDVFRPSCPCARIWITVSIQYR